MAGRRCEGGGGWWARVACALGAALAGVFLWSLSEPVRAQGVSDLAVRVLSSRHLSRWGIWRTRLQVSNGGGAPFVGSVAVAIEASTLPLASRRDFPPGEHPWVPVRLPRGGVLGPGAATPAVFVHFRGPAEVRPELTARVIERPGAEPPPITLSGPGPGTMVVGAPFVVAGTRRAHVARISVNGTPATLAGRRWEARLSLPDGPARLKLVATDAEGRRLGLLAWPVRVDTRPPVLVLVHPRPGNPVPGSPVRLRVKLIDQSSVSVTVNGKPVPVAGRELRAKVAVPEGSSVINVVARDAAGHQSALHVPVLRLAAPSIVAGRPGPARVGEPWRYVLRAVSPPGAGPVRFRLRSGPPGLSMRGRRGREGEALLSWTPPAAGKYPVRVRVRARPGGWVEHVLVIRVLEAPPSAARGRIVYRYDRSGRLLAAEGDDLPPIRWAYDWRGNLVLRSAP